MRASGSGRRSQWPLPVCCAANERALSRVPMIDLYRPIAFSTSDRLPLAGIDLPLHPAIGVDGRDMLVSLIGGIAGWLFHRIGYGGITTVAPGLCLITAS